jgi:hypothetical protein
MTDQQPVLPPAPWYTSEVQVRAVIAAAAQLVSIALRVIGKYTELSITTDMVDAIVADVTQAAAVIFGILAVTKRQTSAIAPLTITAKQAEVMSQITPPLLDADPTKLPKEAKPNA